MSGIVIYVVGLGAQLLFASRLLVQWSKSEKAGRVLSPTLFWQLSLIASFMMLVYGVLREDFVILLGQVVSYFVYIRNLQYKKAWQLIPIYFKVVVILFPLSATIFLVFSNSYSLLQIFNNPEVPFTLLIWGSLGQAVFTFRFLYQWYYSELSKRSVLPLGFWIISTAGSVIIISYALFRSDPVLLIGQIFGFGIYTRNIYIYFRSTALNAVN
jgi:lipid-A-disaccharide synthase-like uncharacterized protein